MRNEAEILDFVSESNMQKSREKSRVNSCIDSMDIQLGECEMIIRRDPESKKYALIFSHAFESDDDRRKYLYNAVDMALSAYKAGRYERLIYISKKGARLLKSQDKILDREAHLVMESYFDEMQILGLLKLKKCEAAVAQGKAAAETHLLRLKAHREID